MMRSEESCGKKIMIGFNSIQIAGDEKCPSAMSATSLNGIFSLY